MSTLNTITDPPATIDHNARLMIDDLISDYAHAIDDDQLERGADFFTEDGTYKLIARENLDAGMELGIVTCEGRGMMRDRILALREANIYEPHTYCHLLGRTRIEDADGRYRARTNFSVIRTMQDGRNSRFATGKYLDEFVFENGRARLRSRVVVLESRQIDVLLVIPL